MSRLTPLLVLLASVAMATPAGAQTIRDKVKDHVDKNLNKDKDKDKDKDKNGDEGDGDKDDAGKSKDDGKDKAGGGDGAGEHKRPRRGSRDHSTVGDADDPDATTYEVTLDAEDEELVNPTGPKLPLRLLPGRDYLSLNVKVDGAYRGWIPQQYDSASVKMGNYFTWSVAVRGRFFGYVTLHRGYYESNALSTPRNHKASVAAQIGAHTPKAAWVLAKIGFPFLKTWEPVIRYEARAFSTTADPRIPVCIVGRDTSTDIMDCPMTDERLRMISAFETFVAGVQYNSSAKNKTIFATKKSKFPPIYAGVGLLRYHKPYQVTIDGDTLEEFLFDGRFQGAGLALGTSIGGGARRFYADLDLQIGAGEVSLTDDLTLNEIAPKDWLIGYVHGSLTTGYRFVIFEGAPTTYLTPSFTGGGASFHFVSTSAEEGEMQSSPNVNWDFLWSGRLALEVAL